MTDIDKSLKKTKAFLDVGIYVRCPNCDAGHNLFNEKDAPDFATEVDGEADCWTNTRNFLNNKPFKPVKFRCSVCRFPFIIEDLEY